MSKQVGFKVTSAKQTAALAKALAAEVSATKKSKNAVVIGLLGNLGAGKTTFVKAFVRGNDFKWEGRVPLDSGTSAMD